jgi:NAD(P)-dependent dehydrogenase (short-subunit alcohol dehydrogenase family)
MSGLCDGRVVIVTGAGNGIGRAHAHRFAAEGAHVVVNDLGGSPSGEGQDASPAQQVASEIEAAGGRAVANTDDISTWAGAERVVEQAIDTFGTLDVLVNNAGILRDRTVANMSEAEWDAVIKVHLKGTFAPTHFAAAYWRDRSKAGEPVSARVVNTTSPSGIFGSPGQANYGSAKAGIAAFTIITAQELARYGVTVNAVAPTALTRLTADVLIGDALDETARNALSPDTISPLVVWLGSTASASITGRVLGVWGNKISVAEGWVYGPHIDRDAVWTPGELGEIIPGLVTKAAPNAGVFGDREPAGG